MKQYQPHWKWHGKTKNNYRRKKIQTQKQEVMYYILYIVLCYSMSSYMYIWVRNWTIVQLWYLQTSLLLSSKCLRPVWQGFRDRFTEKKNYTAFSSSEHTDLFRCSSSVVFFSCPSWNELDSCSDGGEQKLAIRPNSLRNDVFMPA